MEAALQTTGDIPSSKQVFIPPETPDNPYDVTLVVEDGKEFKAHRRVLSEASPIFEELLNSNTRESDERVVRLKMLTELGLRDILEFIYTGTVEISVKDNDLISMADCLGLHHLKTFAGKVLAQKLNVSNSMSTYYFAETYRCEQLISVSKNFILANFTAVAKTEDFLNLSCEKVKMWISSDEIVVSAEEDVFKLILAWVYHEKSERKKYFAELFSEVRLVYVSRDYLYSDMVKNDLVRNDNEGCMDRVKVAMELIGSKICSHHLSVKPRKSLDIPVVVVSLYSISISQPQEQILCYFPQENTWCKFPDTVPPYSGKVISCHGNLYFISQPECKLLRYDSLSNCWTSLPYEEQRTLHQLFLRNEDEIFALVTEDKSCPGCVSLRSLGISIPCRRRHRSFVTKYKPESNSWEDITSFEGTRVGICVVAKDNFIYFLGGFDSDSRNILADADRYNLNTNTRGKIADLREPRMEPAYGAAAYGKIFIAGGTNVDNTITESCEVYNETTNEWQFIARLSTTPSFFKPTWVCADGRLYVLNGFGFIRHQEDRKIVCYDPDRNEWNEKTQIPVETMLPLWEQCEYFSIDFSFSMRVFKGSKFLQRASISDVTCSYSKPVRYGKHKCVIV